jgi:hypothetical protein
MFRAAVVQTVVLQGKRQSCSLHYGLYHFFSQQDNVKTGLRSKVFSQVSKIEDYFLKNGDPLPQIVPSFYDPGTETSCLAP